MAGIFGVVSEKNCMEDLFLGTFYLQHRAQDYCGMAWQDGKKMNNETHRGLMRQQFSKQKLKEMKGQIGIGAVSGYRQPVSELADEGMILCYDGNIINYSKLKESLLRKGATFSGYHNPEEVNDSVLISKLIAKESNFEKGVESLVQQIRGDFAIVALKKEGIYAARGWGRKPLILGKKEGSFAVSSESSSFENTGFEIFRDVEPGEIVLLDTGGVHTLEKLNLSPVKYGTFEWIYTSYPSSIIDGRSVADARMDMGKLLAKKYPVDADWVSPIPNSGRWHAIGYSEESKIPFAEVFIRYDYSDRSYTPQEQVARDEEARIKLIPVRKMVDGKRIILLDDSIVRGTQTLNQVKRLKELGAREVHARIACPPLMAACRYGKTTREDKSCIARRMPIEDIQKTLNLDSLCYASIEDLEKAIGFPREKLCLECWEG